MTGSVSQPTARRVEDLLARRIVVLDGATGTMLLDRAGGGPVDALCLGAPDAVRELHRAYLAAGADVVKTNSFNATRVALAEFGQARQARALNEAAAALARAVADAAERAEPTRPRFVAGVLGPTRRLVHLPPHLARAGALRIDFASLADAYAEAAGGLLAGGADLLLIESVCGSENARAAIQAVHGLEQAAGRHVPLMISATVGADGRMLTGQPIDGFWDAVRHARPLAVGLNCAFGAEALRRPLEALARAADCPISAHPNAGLPDAAGGYPDAPAAMAAELRACAAKGLVNLVGGCCGTTPAHIAALAAAVRDHAPRRIATEPPSDDKRAR